MKKRCRKLNNKGFTLIELLVVIFIISILTALMAGIMPRAMDAYFNTVDKSNAQVLLSTGIEKLRDEMGTASEIKIENNKITYKDGSTGNKSYIRLDTGTGIIYLNEDVANSTNERPIVEYQKTKDMSGTLIKATGRISLTCSAFSSSMYDKANGIITFYGVKVTKDKNGRAEASGDKALAGPADVKIRTEKVKS